MPPKTNSRLRPLPVIASLVVFSLIAIQKTSARPADPWPGPAGDYLFFEAEDMALHGGGWTVEESPKNPIGGIPSNLKALAGNVAGNGEAAQALVIPADGPYRVWVRFNQQLFRDAKKRGPFQIVVSQNGKDLLTHTFDETYDGLDSTPRDPTKLLWQSVTANLLRGPATLTLRKIGPEKSVRGSRQIDCFLLTTDLAY